MHRGRLIFGGVAIAGLLVAAVALAAPGGQPGPPPAVGGSGQGRPAFTITGDVAPVYPFASSTLELRIENPMSFTILVTEVGISIGDASASCAAENLIIQPVAVPFEVPGSGAVIVSTTARLVEDAADSCQSAVFPLAYNGAATKP